MSTDFRPALPQKPTPVVTDRSLPNIAEICSYINRNSHRFFTFICRINRNFSVRLYFMIFFFHYSHFYEWIIKIKLIRTRVRFFFFLIILSVLPVAFAAGRAESRDVAHSSFVLRSRFPRFSFRSISPEKQ